MNYKLTLTAVGAFVLGALAVQSLHAQMKPPAYVVGEITVKDENGYKNEFLPATQPIIAKLGGKYVAGEFNKTMTIDGAQPPNRVIIIQFESMDAVRAWADNQEQKDSRKIGDKYAIFRTYAVEGAMH